MKSIKAKWIVSLLPEVRVLVKKGQSVEFDELLAEMMVTEEKIVNLSSDMAILMNKRIGFVVKKGDFLGEKGYFFKKKIFCPVEGEIVKVDEYNNVYLASIEKIRREILSPIESVVTEISPEGLTLEFKAEEFLGMGLSEGRVWGKNGVKEAGDVGDLSMADNGKIIILNELSPLIVAKAEVIGVAGLVVKNGDRINTKLPIVKVDPEEYQNILNEIKNAKRAMLDAGGGRLLLAI